jgi:hypothetical protein
MNRVEDWKYTAARITDYVQSIIVSQKLTTFKVEYDTYRYGERRVGPSFHEIFGPRSFL